MKGNMLGNALRDAMRAAPGERNEVDARKERIKAELDRAKELVDSGRLACIIVTEYLDDTQQRLQSVPYGDMRVVQQTAKNLLRRELEKNRDAFRPIEPEPEQGDAGDAEPS